MSLRPYRIKDLTGQKFGKLIVLSLIGRNKGKTYWLCKCDCGKTKEVIGYCLKLGYSKSCGCSKGRPGISKSKLIKGDTSLKKLFYRYSRRAKNENMVFEFNINEFEKLTKQNCYYCNMEPKQILKTKYSNYIYNGIDRVDNSIGYTLKNSVSCCGKCNTSKGNISVDIIEKLYYHLLNNGYFN